MQRRAAYTAVAAILELIASSVHAETYLDWAIACDNTRHCEAVGAQHDENAPPVTLWLGRDAGPNTPLHARLMLQGPDQVETSPDTITVGHLQLDDFFADDDALTASALKQLLPAMLEAPSAEIIDRRASLKWTLSLAGLKAALFKMDEMQGRVGTPGALVRKGSAPEWSVLRPLPAPRIKPANVPPARQEDSTLLDRILRVIKSTEGDCWEAIPDGESPETGIYRLTAKTVLITRECGRAAYQNASRVWIANATPPFAARRVAFPTDTGEKEDELVNLSFDNGVMNSVVKGRGLADCVDSRSWLWTGTGFALIEALQQPICKGITGGGYSLRTWTAEIQR